MSYEMFVRFHLESVAESTTACLMKCLMVPFRECSREHYCMSYEMFDGSI